MNNDVVHILKRYSQQNVGHMLENTEQVMHDISIIKTTITDMDLELKTKAILLLEDLLKAVEQKIDQLNDNMAQGSEIIESIKRNSEACLAYMRPIQNHKDKTEKDL